MCYMCLRDDIFYWPTDREVQTKELQLKGRAIKIKELLRIIDSSAEEMCHIGDAIEELLKKEQYEIAKQL